jgi:hypothetical protein
LKACALTSSRTPDWRSAYSSSCVRYAGLMLTRIAPIFAVANCTRIHSTQFGAQMPTRSPFSMPAASSPQAMALTASSSSA